MSGVEAESLLAATYACILLATALGLDVLARHSHARADSYGVGGFRFHPHVDAWECPEGEFLHLAEVDHDRRLLRYRARPLVCNACPAKEECTDADDGREIVRSLGDWAESEVGRFHRVVSLSLVALAGLVALVAGVRNHDPVELALLAAVVAAAVLVARRLGGGLRAERADPRLLA